MAVHSPCCGISLQRGFFLALSATMTDMGCVLYKDTACLRQAVMRTDGL